MNILQQSGIFGIIVLAIFVMLFLTGIIAIIITRSSKVAILLMLLAFLPLLFGMIGTGIGYNKANQLVNTHGQTMSIELRQEAQSEGRNEARSTTYIGSVATLILIMVFGCGYAISHKSNKSRRDNHYQPFR